MSIRKSLFGAVSIVALMAAGPAMAQSLPQDGGTETSTDVRTDNSAALDADIRQRGDEGQAYIDQSNVNSNPHTRAVIEQSGTGANDAFINQDEEGVTAKIDQAGPGNGDADIYQDEIGDSRGDGTKAVVDQQNATNGTVDVYQRTESSLVDVDQSADGADTNIVQLGDDNYTKVKQTDAVASGVEQADVLQRGELNAARIVQ